MFDLSKTEGLITEVTGISLTNESVEHRDNTYIVVNDMQMDTDDPYYSDYFGFIAEVYYTEESPGAGMKAVIIIPSDKAEVKEIEAEDAISFNSSRALKYYDENDRERSIDFIPDLDVIYNNKPLLDYEFDEVLPDFGTIKAIDYDGDGNYDIMVIKAVKTYVVNWVDAGRQIIYPKAVNGETPTPIEYDETDDRIAIYNIEGELTELSALEEWNVLSVETSANADGERVTNIYASDAFARGDISSIDDEYITIRNKKYKIAETIDRSELDAGDSGMFYLDYYGRIAAFDGDKYDEGKYGFISRVLYDDELEKVGFRIFTASGSFKEFLISDHIKIDGVQLQSNPERLDVIDTLLLGGGTNGDYRQLVKYTENAKGEITVIDTVYRGIGENDESLTRDFEAADRYYKGEDGTFGMVLTLAVVMNIPENFDCEDDYTIGASFKWDANNSFEAYDCGPLNDAKVALVVATSDAAIQNTAQFFVVDKIKKGLNRYEEPVNILSGWHEGQYVSYSEYEEGIIEAQNLKRGDIICVLLSANKEIKQIEKRFYLGSRPENAPANSISQDTPMGPSGGYTPYWDIFLVYGTVVAKEGKYIKVRTDTSGTADGYTLPKPSYETMIVNLNGSRIEKYIYDSEEDEVRLATDVDFVDEESAGVGSTVVLRAASGQVRDIVILK